MQLRCQKTPFPGGFSWCFDVAKLRRFKLVDSLECEHLLFSTRPVELFGMFSFQASDFVGAFWKKSEAGSLAGGSDICHSSLVFITSSVRVSETLRTSNESMTKWCWQKKCWTGEKEFFIMIFYHGCHVHRWFSNQSIRPGDPRRGFFWISASIRSDSKRLDESR